MLNKKTKKLISTLMLIVLCIVSLNLDTIASFDVVDSAEVNKSSTKQEDLIDATDTTNTTNTTNTSDTIDVAQDNLRNINTTFDDDDDDEVIIDGAGVGCITFWSYDKINIILSSYLQFDGQLEICQGDFSTGWKTPVTGERYSSALAGDKYYISIRGSNNTYVNNSDWDNNRTCFNVGNSDNIYSIGGVESLLDYQTVLDGNHPTAANATFRGLFYGSSGNFVTVPTIDMPIVPKEGCKNMFAKTKFKKAPIITAHTIRQEGCYQMFYSNTYLLDACEMPNLTKVGVRACAQMYRGDYNIEKASELPATELAEECYCEMFNGCYSIATPPSSLPAMILAKRCYALMFNECRALEEPPILPATELADECYKEMFSSARSLARSPELPATVLAPGCYERMFLNCWNLKETMSVLPALTLVDRCYASMFSCCEYQLQIPPVIAATNIGDPNNMYRMFWGCKSLVIFSSPGMYYGRPVMKKWIINSDENLIFNEIGYNTKGPNDLETGVAYYTLSDDVIIDITETTWVYDGEPHQASIEVLYPTDKTPTILYSETEGVYSLTTQPSYSTVGEHVVYYKATAEGCKDTYGQYTLEIQKATIVVNAEDYTTEFDGTQQTRGVEVTKPIEDAKILYSESEGEYNLSDPPSYVNPGTYTVYYKVTADNHNDNTGSYKIIITNGTITATVNSYTGSYDGEMHTGEIIVTHPTEDAVITYSSTLTGDYTTSPISYVNAGTYTVYYKINADYFNEAEGSFSITIQKIDMIIEAVDVSFEYDGEPKEAGIKVVNPRDNYNITYSKDGRNYSADNNKFTEPGNHPLHYKVTSNPNYNEMEGTITVTIIKLEDIIIDLGDTNIEYDGKPHSHEITVIDPATGAVIRYSTGGEWTEEAPNFTEPGEYTVYYEIVADGYKTLTGSYTVSVLLPIECSIENVEDNYDGISKSGSVVVTKPSDGSAIITYSTDGITYNNLNPTFTEATNGPQTVYFKIAAPGYYPKEGSFTVNVIGGNMIVSATDVTVMYDGKPHSGNDIEVKKPASGYTITYLDDDNNFISAKPSFTEVGKHRVLYKVSAPNYKDYNAGYTVTIKARDIVLAENSDEFEIPYDGEKHNVKLQVLRPATGYTVKYSENESGEYTTNCPEYIDLGEHTVYYQVTADNYNDLDGSFVLKIVEGNIEVEAKDLSFPYDGTGKTGEIKVIKPTSNYQVEYSSTDDKNSFGDANPEFTEIGEYTLYYKVTAENYNELTGEITVSILDTIDAQAEDVIVEYDGEAHTGKVDVTKPTTGYTITYSRMKAGTYAESIPQFVEPGQYNVYYKVTADKYAELSGSFKVTIVEDGIIAEAEDQIIKYDGEEHFGEVIVKTPSSGYKITYSEDKTTYVDNNFSYTEVGEYVVHYRVSADGYADFEDSFKITITNEELVESVPIYVMLNPNSGEHLLTSKKNEYDKLQVAGWVGEGIAFYGYSKPVAGCTKIYRIFNPNANMGDHHYTKSVGEINKRLVDGWSWDFNRNAVFYAKGDITIYKLFNRPTGRHHYTRKLGEVNKLVAAGWENEGTAWFGAKEGDVEIADEE